MKKILSLIMSLVVVFTFAACGAAKPNDNETTAVTNAVAQENVEAETQDASVEYVGWKLNSAVTEIAIPEEAAAALYAAVGKEDIKFTPVVYVASKEADIPAYQFLCVGEGGMPAVDYEGYNVAFDGVKLFVVNVVGNADEAYVESFYGLDLDGLMNLSDDRRSELIADFESGGWQYFNEHADAVLPAPVEDVVTSVPDFKNLVYFIGEYYEANGNITFAFVCADGEQDATSLNVVFVAVPKNKQPCIKIIAPLA